jgi:Tfp pilus assembly protein PilF
MTLRDAAKTLVDGGTVKGQDAKLMLGILTGSERWRLAVTLALEYLERDNIEMAKQVLEEVLADGKESKTVLGAKET